MIDRYIIRKRHIGLLLIATTGRLSSLIFETSFDSDFIILLYHSQTAHAHVSVNNR